MTSTAPCVLFTTDGSELADRAIDEGASLVTPGGRVVVLTVIPAVDPTLIAGTGHSGPVMGLDEKERLLEAQQLRGDEIVAAAAARLAPTQVETVVLRGSAGDEICRYVTEIGADIVVMGTRGLGGLKRAVLGSVSDHVVRHAECPVLTVATH